MGLNSLGDGGGRKSWVLDNKTKKPGCKDVPAENSVGFLHKGLSIAPFIFLSPCPP